jgi:membrane protease YdiL (CAAX protease family)
VIANSLQRHPLAWFFSLAFGISWGGILVIVAARGFDFSPLQPAEGGLIFLMMLLGPSLSSLICTALTGGLGAFSALWRSALRWRVAPQWLAVALLTTPAILLTILLPLAMVAGPAFRPGLQWPLLAIGLVAGSFEEIGWTGFATPRLLERHGLGRAGLTLGLLWAFWHLLVDLRYNAGAMGPLWPVEFVVVYLATLTPYRMLMTWVFARTESLFAAIVMHASFTGWLLVLFPATSEPQSLAWQAVFGLMLWVLVVGVACRKGEPGPDKGLSR